VLDWWASIDWSATGSMGSFIVALAALVLAYVAWHRQHDQEETNRDQGSALVAIASLQEHMEARLTATREELQALIPSSPENTAARLLEELHNQIHYLENRLVYVASGVIFGEGLLDSDQERLRLARAPIDSIQEIDEFVRKHELHLPANVVSANTRMKRQFGEVLKKYQNRVRFDSIEHAEQIAAFCKELLGSTDEIRKATLAAFHPHHDVA